MKNQEQFLGYNRKAWNSYANRQVNWMYVEFIAYVNGWLTVTFAHHGQNRWETQENIRERVKKADIPAYVMELLNNANSDLQEGKNA